MAAPAGAITGGQLDSRHGNVGAVLVEIPGVGIAAVGSGTLVGPDAVLTAGHVTAYLQMLILQGVISLADKFGAQSVFSELDLKILCMIVRQAAIAIENAKMYRQLNYLTF